MACCALAAMIDDAPAGSRLAVSCSLMASSIPSMCRTRSFAGTAMIATTVEGDLRPVGDALTEMPEVSYVVTTAGSVDLLAEVVCEDDDELLDLLTTRIRTLPGVRTTETFVYLKLNKQHYDWGTR